MPNGTAWFGNWCLEFIWYLVLVIWDLQNQYKSDLKNIVGIVSANKKRPHFYGAFNKYTVQNYNVMA